MRIAIDARELRGQPTGVGRLVAEVLRAWETMPEARAHEVVQLAPHTGGGTMWEQLTLPGLVRKARADVLLSPAYSGPLRGHVPMVVAIHDVSFAAHPEWFHWKEGLRRRTLARLSARRAARVLTISEFSKGEIVRHLGIDADKIEVAYPGVTRVLPARRVVTAPPAPSVLFVGSIFNRRHVPELIEAFTGLARRTPAVRLEIVGDNRTMPHVDIGVLARRTGLVDRIGVQSYVAEDELAALYGRAGVFVFLSDYEGFGLTPIEALAAGIPIVVLDTPIAREVYGTAALYVDRPEPSLIERAIEQALFDRAERARILAAATDVLARYSWETFARQVLQVLVEAGSHPH